MDANETGRNLYLGLNVGGTTCSAAIGDGSGAVLRHTQWPSEVSRGPGRKGVVFPAWKRHIGV